MPIPPETMQKSISCPVFWISKQFGMLHYNEESNIMKYSTDKNGIVSLEKCIDH